MNKPFITPPSFNPHLHTVRFDTTLPYNCIYFVSGHKKDSDYGIIHLRDNNTVLTIQDFPFFTYEIQGSHLESERLLSYLCDNNPFFKDIKKDILSTLREIFPKTEEGCFVVRLMPYRDQTDNNYIDTLLICETKYHFYNDTLRKFAVEAARLNYERMTGNTYNTENHQCTFYSKGFFKDRDWNNETKSLYRPLRPNHFESPNTKSARLLENEEIKQQRKRIMRDYRKQLEHFSNPFIFQSDSSSIRDLINSAYDDIDDIDKFSTLCPIKVLPKDSYYDIFICPKDREPVRCDFSRGWAAKALYIFFLRHPEGFHPIDMDGRQYIKELAAIYQKLKGGDDETVFEKASAIAIASTKKKKGTRAENLNSIKSWFEEHFIHKIAYDYAIGPMVDRGDDQLYGINIPREMIDLGIFDFKLNIDD